MPKIAALTMFQTRTAKAWVTRRANLRKQGLLTRTGKPTPALLEQRSEQAHRAWATRRAAAEALAKEEKRLARMARKQANSVAPKATRRKAA